MYILFVMNFMDVYIEQMSLYGNIHCATHDAHLMHGHRNLHLAEYFEMLRLTPALEMLRLTCDFKTLCLMLFFVTMHQTCSTSLALYILFKIDLLV